MYRYLIDHAVKNVWCNNEQDNQLIFKAGRLSKFTGVLNRVTVMRRVIELPTNGKYYHVYQIGQVTPSIIGLLCLNPGWVKEEWISFKTAINELKLFVNIYTKEGLEFPKFNSYFMFTKEKCLIFAIEKDKNIPVDVSLDDIYLRLYSNSFYNSTRDDTPDETIYANGVKIDKTKSTSDFLSDYYNYKSKEHGHVFCSVNGFSVTDLDATVYKEGDTVDFIFDGSVKRVVEFTARSLHTFTSILDIETKYLLHYNSDLNDTIDYQDDLDTHVFYKNGIGRGTGLYYPRNTPDSIRMVTHRDYAIPVDYFDYTADCLNNFLGTNYDKLDFKIQLTIRQAGYYRPLIFDNNRILELYKLPDEKIVQAMVNINSTVQEWRAEELENSGYTEIMRSDLSNITMGMLQSGYGYNAISKILGDTPQKVSDINLRVKLPYGLMENSTVYEYDADGVLLESHYHALGSEYVCYNNLTKSVEVIYGKGSNVPNVKFGSTLIPLPLHDNYRVYMNFPNSNLPEKWYEITDSEYYTVEGGKLIWSNLVSQQLLMVRSDDSFLSYDLQLSPVGGNFYFTLAELENRDGSYKNYKLPIPLGELDIFLNGKSLIRGLDYYIDFPTIYIINKKHLLQPAYSTVQNLHIRFTGFCNKDFTLDEIEDYGFIEHGVFSNNSRFDIRDDKVLRITLDGNLKHREDIVFSELHSGISVTDPINGLPYQIKDIVVPLRELTDENTYSLRHKSIVIDKKVSDYMTIQLPEPKREANSAIIRLYPLVSPFISHIIDDMSSGMITNSEIFGIVPDNGVLKICKKYEYLLEFDPVNDKYKMNPLYTIIYPHHEDNVINLKSFQYRFLLSVIKLYAKDKIQLSPFLTFTP